jgi:protein SCO1/2
MIMKKFKYITILLLILLINNKYLKADTPQPEEPVGIVEKLGDHIPMDLTFLDEQGRPIQLKQVINKPTILTFVYYRCPGICTPLLNGVTDVIGKTDLEPGKDYNIITISFDRSETYLTAAEKKKNYLESVKKPVDPLAWRFLTGDSATILKVTRAAGFMFKQTGSDFAHGSGIIMLSPDGEIVRYLYGTDYLPFDIKMAVNEANENKTGPSINKLMKFCFSYDPEGRKYALNVTRIAGSVVILFSISFLLILTLKKKKNLNT